MKGGWGQQEAEGKGATAREGGGELGIWSIYYMMSYE
jgi:hypothetical protein